MADSKITGLAALTTADPANDMLPIVDVSDNSMAASGTTKRISINNILACSPSATLASATISGDLTVDTSTLKVDSTNDRVGIGIAAPAYRLHVQGTASLQMVLQSNDTNANAKEGTVNVRHYTNAEEPVSAVGGFTTSTANEVYLGGGFSAGNAATLLGFYTAANNTTTVGTERYRIGSDGTSTWYVGGSTAMTLNSTGLGVGGSPTHKLTVSTTAGATAIFTSSGAATAVTIDNTNANAWGGNLAIATGGVNAGFFGTIGSLVGSTSQNIAIWSTSGNGIVFHTNGDSTARAIIDTSGNVGIGGAPAAAVAGNKKLQITGSNNSAVVLGTSSVNAAARNWAVISNWNAFGDLVFQQSNALGGDPLASGAGTSRMTLDASGRLILLASTTTPATLTTNGELTMTATSNTNLRFSYRGSDGTTRVADITLA